jgi:hypothetical protein
MFVFAFQKCFFFKKLNINFIFFLYFKLIFSKFFRDLDEFSIHEEIQSSVLFNVCFLFEWRISDLVKFCTGFLRI